MKRKMHDIVISNCDECPFNLKDPEHCIYYDIHLLDKEESFEDCGLPLADQNCKKCNSENVKMVCGYDTGGHDYNVITEGLICKDCGCFTLLYIDETVARFEE